MTYITGGKDLLTHIFIIYGHIHPYKYILIFNVMKYVG